MDSYLNSLPLLPEDSKVIRASGLVTCDICGKIYYKHEHFAYPSREGSVVKACDGVYLHL